MTGVKRPFTEIDTNPKVSLPANQQSSSHEATEKATNKAPVCKSPRRKHLSSPNAQTPSVGSLESSGSQLLSSCGPGKLLFLSPSSSRKVGIHPRKTPSEFLPSFNDNTHSEEGGRTSANPRSLNSSKTLDLHSSYSEESSATKSLVVHPAVSHNDFPKSNPSSQVEAIKIGDAGIKITQKASKSGFVRLIEPVPVPGSAKKLVGKLIIKRPFVTTLPGEQTQVGSSSSEKPLKSCNSGSSKSTKSSSNDDSSATKQCSKTTSLKSTKTKPSKDVSKTLDDLDPEAMRVMVRKSALVTLTSLARKKTNTGKNIGNSCPDKAENKKENIPTQDTLTHEDNAEVLQERGQEATLAVSASPESTDENAATEKAGQNKSADDENSDVNRKEMENLVKSLPPQPITDQIERNIDSIDFESLKRLGCRAKMRSLLWTSKFEAKLEITSRLALGNPVLEGQKKQFFHMRKLAEKAFRKVNDYRYFKGKDKLEWNEMLYEVCSSCNCEMIGGGRFLERPNFNLGTDSRSAAVRIFLRGEAVLARREGYINEPVTEAMLNEFKDRKYHKQTLLNSHMRYGAIDIFGNEENFAALIVLSRQPPFQFSARRTDT